MDGFIVGAAVHDVRAELAEHLHEALARRDDHGRAGRLEPRGAVRDLLVHVGHVEVRHLAVRR